MHQVPRLPRKSTLFLDFRENLFSSISAKIYSVPRLPQKSTLFLDFREIYSVPLRRLPSGLCFQSLQDHWPPPPASPRFGLGRKLQGGSGSQSSQLPADEATGSRDPKAENRFLHIDVLFLVIGAIILCLFPLWPMQMREYVWYLSVFAAIFLGALIVVALRKW